MSGVVINKVGADAPVPMERHEPSIPANVPTVREAVPSGATRTFPRGILRRNRKTARILPTADPARPPPTRRRKLRLTAGNSAEEKHKTLHKRAEKLPLKTIRKKLQDKGIVRADRKVAPSILRTLYAESVGAGLLAE